LRSTEICAIDAVIISSDEHALGALVDTLAERMRWLREHWKESARGLSQSLGLNSGAWTVYESGTSQPGAAVLTELAARNVDVNWLLTGRGNPFRGEHDVMSILNQVELRESKLLGLSELSLLAAKASVGLKSKLLQKLTRRSPDGLSLDELWDGMDVERQAVALAIVELIRSGHVEVLDREGTQVYRSKTVLVNTVSKEADIALIAMDAVKFISHDVAEGVIEAPTSTLLLRATLGVADGRAFLKGLQNYLFQSGLVEGETETVKLVIAAKVVENAN